MLTDLMTALIEYLSSFTAVILHCHFHSVTKDIATFERIKKPELCQKTTLKYAWSSTEVARYKNNY